MDKKAKRNKRLENLGIKPDESGSEASESEEAKKEGEDSEDDGENKKKVEK